MCLLPVFRYVLEPNKVYEVTARSKFRDSYVRDDFVDKINLLKPTGFFTFHQVCLLTYLLTYLLHGAESFLRS